MTTFMTHRNKQSYDAGRFVRETRGKIKPTRTSSRHSDRLVLAMVLGLTGMACWSAADIVPVQIVAGIETVQVTA